MATSGMELDTSEDAPPEKRLKAVTERSVSMESDGSNYTDAMENVDSDQDDDMGGYYDEDDDDTSTGEHQMNPQLYGDMENIILLYGDSAVHYRLLQTIDEIDVELNIPLGFLDSAISEAWNIKRDEPLVIRLHLSLSRYVEAGSPPKVEVFQPSKKERFGFGSQIKKILETFLSENWKTVSPRLKVLNTERARMSKSQSFPVQSSDNSAQFNVSDIDLVRLIELGFSIDLARNALIITRGNVEDATNLLLTNPESCSSYEFDKLAEQTVAPARPPKAKRQLSHPPLLKQLKKLLPFQRQASMVTSTTDPSISSGTGIEDLSLLPLSTLDGKNAKKVPELTDGFLVQVFRYVRQRIPTLNEYCVVCDEPHVFQNGAMLKPAVCSRELCVFAFQTLGVMSDAADDIATGAEVVDLLISMTRAACKSHRKNIIFDPFPTIVDPANPCELAFHPKNKETQYKKIEEVFDKIVPMEEMSKMGSSNMKRTLDTMDPLIYPLLQWVITSNRSHIVKLPRERQLSFMHTPHQFLLLSSPPAKEAAFRAAKEKHGSTFVFHGSSIENWHSIIRQGLFVASGTKLQVNGAAYGKGIYLSPHAATSFGYSRMGYGSRNVKKTATQSKSRFLSSQNITCIALCEVIVSPNLKKSGGIWVCPESDHVCTRFFFVYEDGQVGDSNIDTQQKVYLEEIKKAVNYRA